MFIAKMYNLGLSWDLSLLLDIHITAVIMSKSFVVGKEVTTFPS